MLTVQTGVAQSEGLRSRVPGACCVRHSNTESRQIINEFFGLRYIFSDCGSYYRYVTMLQICNTEQC